MSVGLLLIQLGTPRSAQVSDVDKYLRQFLMDPYVIDIPWVVRWPLVQLAIVPRRAPESAEAYSQVWDERGSPLRYHSEDLKNKVKSLLPDVKVELGMRYGDGSIEESLNELMLCKEIYVIPLYPQYALSSTETALAQVRKWYKKFSYPGTIHYLEDFFKNPGFISSQAEVIREEIDNFNPDHLLLSFHGLPVRHVKKTSKKCFVNENCCDSLSEENRYCYRAQSFYTARSLVSSLNWPNNKYTVSFQSRLGRTVWIPPYTDELLDDLAAKGVKRLLVSCPSFTADCLETLEEIAIRGKEQFQKAGGEDLHLVPAVNSRNSWAQAVVGLLNDSGQWKHMGAPH